MSKGMESRSMGVSRDMIEQVWEKIRPEELPKLRQAPKERIVVIKGSYDGVEKILGNAQIPYVLVGEFPKVGDLSQGGKYRACRAMFVNCDASYHNGVLEDKGLTRANKGEITDFVENGGRLITTDWAQVVVKYLFGKISATKGALPEETIQVEFPNEIARKLAGIRYGNVTPRWWIEGSSDKISFKADSGVVELITSEELKKEHGSRYIAVGFQQGKGEVFHFVSHLVAQKIGKYGKDDRNSLQTMVDATGVAIKDSKNLGLGQIATSYTLMNTVLELCRDTNILGGITTA